jgi:cytochrome c oxidase subunit IV
MLPWAVVFDDINALCSSSSNGLDFKLPSIVWMSLVCKGISYMVDIAFHTAAYLGIEFIPYYVVKEVSTCSMSYVLTAPSHLVLYKKIYGPVRWSINIDPHLQHVQVSSNSNNLIIAIRTYIGR